MSLRVRGVKPPQLNGGPETSAFDLRRTGLLIACSEAVVFLKQKRSSYTHVSEREKL
jgi:hypothetical protein